jgi:hypothetical protein
VDTGGRSRAEPRWIVTGLGGGCLEHRHVARAERPSRQRALPSAVRGLINADASFAGAPA